MITLYHCDGARSFRPLWMLEEMGLPYELKMLPFPPAICSSAKAAVLRSRKGVSVPAASTTACA